MSAQRFSRADRNRRRRGLHARVNRPAPIRYRRDGSVIPTAITAEAARFLEARRRRLGIVEHMYPAQRAFMESPATRRAIVRRP